MLSYRSARPWLARLGLLGQLVLLTSLGAAPAHAAPPDRAVATAGVISHRAGAAATAVDAGPVAGWVTDGTVTPGQDAAAYGPTEADSESSSPRTHGALVGGLLGALGGLLIAVIVKLVRRAVERREQRAMPFPQGAPVPVPHLPTPAASPPSATAPASVVGFAPPAVPTHGGPATAWMPTMATPVAPPGRTAPPAVPPVPVGPPQPARPPGRPPRYGPRCANCRELVPTDAAYCGECGLSQHEPPFGEETAGAGRLSRLWPARWRRWHRIAALAVAGVALAAAVIFHQQASPMSARDTVEAYFDALADRDADRARSLLSADYAKWAPMTLTSGAALRDPGYHPPRHLQIKVVVVRDDVAEMEGEYEQDGKRQKTGLYLLRDGRGGERRPWSINHLPGLDPPSGEYGFEALLIAGTRAPAGFIEAVFHGSYLVSLPDHPIREVTAPVTVRAGGGREQGVLRTRVRDSARESIETQVRAYLDRCAASTELRPEGCPLSAWSPTPVKDVAWLITGYPALEITLGPDGTAEVAGSAGTATVTMGGAVPAENMSFNVHGYARAAGDRALFVPT